MPSLQPENATVLVTGGTGYIGAWVVKYLLECGFAVKLAVRNDDAAEYFRTSMPSYKDKISHTIVADITSPNAYDEAVKNVDGIIHLASPVSFTADDPQELIGPAVRGTVGILQSAMSHGDRVERVVITSSIVAALSLIQHRLAGNPALTLTEADWNEVSVKKTEELGSSAHPSDKYAASKTLAEQAAWDFIEKEHPPFDLVTVLPVIAFGPYMHQALSREKLQNSSVGFFMEFVNPRMPGNHTLNFVDVRDAAEIHVLALTTQAAGGERILASRGGCSTQEIWDIVHSISPPIPGIPQGQPGANYPHLLDVSTAKALKLFPGFEFQPLEVSVVDLAKQLDAKGWLSEAAA